MQGEGTVTQKHRHTDTVTQTDIATYRLNWRRGRIGGEKIQSIKEG